MKVLKQKVLHIGQVNFAEAFRVDESFQPPSLIGRKDWQKETHVRREPENILPAMLWVILPPFSNKIRKTSHGSLGGTSVPGSQSKCPTRSFVVFRDRQPAVKCVWSNVGFVMGRREGEVEKHSTHCASGKRTAEQRALGQRDMGPGRGHAREGRRPHWSGGGGRTGSLGWQVTSGHYDTMGLFAAEGGVRSFDMNHQSVPQDLYVCQE